MSLADLVFDGMFRGDGVMFDGDGTPRRPRKCSWCGKECEDEGEEFCRACFPGCDPGVGESTGEQLAAAALALGTMFTPTAAGVPMQTAAGTPSAQVPVVDVSPVAT